MDKVELLGLYSVNELRKKFVITEYLRLRSTCTYSSIQQIAREIAQLPCSYFMIPLRIAKILYNIHILNRRDSWYEPRIRRPFFRSFIERMQQLHSANNNQPRKKIIHDAICSPAPNIGVGTYGIRRIIEDYEKTKKHRKHTE